MITFESNQESQEDNNKQLANQIKRGQRDKWLQEPTKNIHEMISSTQVNSFNPFILHFISRVRGITLFYWNCLGW